MLLLASLVWSFTFYLNPAQHTVNCSSFETPILLSGTSDSVRNVLRMIIDLYHMNNLSSELWQHLRLSSIVGDQDDTVLNLTT